MKLDGRLAVTAQAKRRRYKTPHTAYRKMRPVKDNALFGEKCSGMLLKINQVVTARLGDMLVRRAPGG